MAKNPGKGVAKRPPAGVPAELDESALYDGHDAAGDDMSAEDIAIPRLTILQALSPQCQKREATYIDGAEPGMIYDTVSGDMWNGEEGVVIIPVYFRHTHIEWITRDKGGGFVRDWGLVEGKVQEATTVRDDMGRDMLPNGNQLVNTMEYVVYRVDTEGAHQAIISFTSSQIRKGKKLNANAIKPLGPGITTPFYSRGFRFTTLPESNEKGNWFGWNILFEFRSVQMPASGYAWCDVAEFISQAAAFRKLLVDGQLQFTPPTQGGAEGEADPEKL